MTENKDNTAQQFTIGSWKQEDTISVYQNLEVPNWAAWLAASTETLAGRAEVFPKGQLIIKSSDGEPLASLSMNLISWNGQNEDLPSWDEVAGEPTTYVNTYDPKGNALVLMSMNVSPEHQGSGYARMLVEKAKSLAQELGVDYLIGSFRPNEYGRYKLANLGKTISFEEYCNMQREDGWPVDSWLRNLKRNGMQPLKVDHRAMVVKVSVDEFSSYQQLYKPELWVEVLPNVWECGEVGSWKVDEKTGIVTYEESNLWGIIWKNPGLQ